MVSLNCSLYSKGGRIKATVPAAIAPMISRKVVKSGIIRAIPVTIMITNDLMRTDLTFFTFLDPVLKVGCYSAISNAAKIWTGYDTKAFMQTQNRMNVTRPLIGCKLSVNIGFVSSLYTT